MEEVKAFEINIHEELKTNTLALEWLNSADDDVKSQKFDQLITQVGAPALGRSWSYPDAANWPLIDWNNVENLDKLFTAIPQLWHEDSQALIFQVLGIDLG